VFLFQLLDLATRRCPTRLDLSDTAVIAAFVLAGAAER
jgi:hypothetical protein